MPMGEEQLTAALADTAVFAEFALDPATISLAGVADVNGVKAYELKVVIVSPISMRLIHT